MAASPVASSSRSSRVNDSKNSLVLVVGASAIQVRKVGRAIGRSIQ
ncbi:hypothetical protein OG562_01795 [Streptomyces sp. NBC_01275]|nr:hypothetical protein [Streptomyces sp. NBC_01275]MCX4759739.1 hypothetical protein [Streptomyces sp. NBC_01275]